jgi:cholesterol oxidase
MGTHLNVTEWMRGHVGFGAIGYVEGERLGKEKDTVFEHEVLIEMTDIDRFVSEPTHAAPMKGTVNWLGKHYEFSGGEFNMIIDSTDPRVKHMFYRIPYVVDGKPMTMLGHKQLTDDAGLDLPKDITTLFIHIYDKDVGGHDFTKPSPPQPIWPDGEIARGILNIPLRDGINSALSFDAPGSSRVEKLAAVAKFLKFYGEGVYELYVAQNRIKRTLFIGGIAFAILAIVTAIVMAVR